MRPLLIYWLLGCLVIGPALGKTMNKCPHDKMPIVDVVGSIAVWPALLLAALALKKSNESGCSLAAQDGR